jgi:hypothetical protein
MSRGDQRERDRAKNLAKQQQKMKASKAGRKSYARVGVGTIFSRNGNFFFKLKMDG